MNQKQKIELVIEWDYVGLVNSINKVIDEYESMYYIDKIDYFYMKDTENGRCTAIILFSPIKL